MTASVPMPEHIPLLGSDVVDRARSGDSAAFAQIIQAYRKRVFAAVARLIGQQEDVEDVAQEIFVRLYHSLRQLRSPELFEAWLGRITANAACDYLRRKKRSHEVRLSDLAEEQAEQAFRTASVRNGAEDRHRTRLKEQVEALLSMIPVRDRVLLVLKEVEGLSLKELEGIYGVDSNVLKRRLFRARQRTLKAVQANAARHAGSAQHLLRVHSQVSQ
ncbi:MAG: RNA polymerase sigma factor [Bryobacteraceae bacterium]